MAATTENKRMDNISSVPDSEEIEIASGYEDGTVDGDLDVHAVGGQSMEDLPPNYYRSPQFIGTVFGFVIGFLSSYYVLVSTSVVFYLFIVPDLGPSPNAVWVLVALTVTQTSTFPIIGRLSDLFGRRYFFLVGNLVAFAGLLVCGRARSINMLIAGTTVVGLGSSFQQSSLSALPELVPRKHRFLALGMNVTMFAPMIMMAPIIAITLCLKTEQSWRWIFYIGEFMTTISGILLFFCYHPPKFRLLHKHQTKLEILRHFDWVGLVVFVGAITVTLLGISWGGQEYPWGSHQVIICLVVGPLAMAAFFLWELRIPEESQVVPLYLFKEKTYVSLAVCAAVASMMFYAVNVMSSLESKHLFDVSLMEAGWISCSATIGAQVGGLIASFTVHKVRHTKWQLVACSVIFTAMIGGNSGVTADKKGMFIAFTVISSMTVGYIEVIALAGAPMSGKDKDIGISAGVVACFRAMMSALATSIYVTIYTNEITKNIPKYVVAAAVNAHFPEESIPLLLQAIGSDLTVVPGMNSTILAAVSSAEKLAYKDSFGMNYLVSITFGGLAIIASLVSENLDGQMNSTIARRLQNTRGDNGLSNSDVEKSQT